MSDHPALSILENLKSHIWQEVQPYLKNPDYPSQFVIPKNYQSESDFHWQMVSDYPNRKGKYLRGSLVVLLAESLGAPAKLAYKTAAAMQLSEDWILIHDDYEDNSPMRRGAKALHHIYGDKLAVNAGDALHALMWKVLSDNRDTLGLETTLRLIDEFYVMLARTTLGQTVEIKWGQENRITNDDDWYFIGDSKTSYYSIAGPMRFGAIIGGADEKQLAQITDLGQNLGRCFQMVDDLLDLTGNFGGLKKEAGDDIYEGKRTIPLGHLLRTSSAADNEKIVAILSKSREQKTPSEIAWIIEKMHNYGSIEYAKNLAAGYRDKALHMIDTDLTFLKSEPARSNLKALADFILVRTH
jgi:geranylgeranyl diphosphate synthase type II